MVRKTIFAHDPGTRSYGYAIVVIERDGRGKLRAQVVENGLCPSTIVNLKNPKVMTAEHRAYGQWLYQVMSRHKIDAISAERYMTRGIKGPTVEAVNMMIGTLLCAGATFGIPVKVMPAATWKNAVRRSGIELATMYKAVRVTPHQLDSSLQGIYTGCSGFRVKDYGDLNLRSIARSLVKQIDASSTNRLINRKTIDVLSS
jgi:Holliday junction resolvasome RuvABC endonuclease subunit